MSGSPNFLKIRCKDISRNLSCQLIDCQMNLAGECIYPLKEKITLIRIKGDLLRCSQYSKYDEDAVIKTKFNISERFVQFAKFFNL